MDFPLLVFFSLAINASSCPGITVRSSIPVLMQRYRNVAVSLHPDYLARSSITNLPKVNCHANIHINSFVGVKGPMLNDKP